MTDTYVLVRMPVEDYLKDDSGPCQAAEALATEFGGVWVGSGTDMTTGMSEIQYRVAPANVVGLLDALRSVGLAGKVLVF